MLMRKGTGRKQEVKAKTGRVGILKSLEGILSWKPCLHWSECITDWVLLESERFSVKHNVICFGGLFFLNSYVIMYRLTCLSIFLFWGPQNTVPVRHLDAFQTWKIVIMKSWKQWNVTQTKNMEIRTQWPNVKQIWSFEYFTSFKKINCRDTVLNTGHFLNRLQQHF